MIIWRWEHPTTGQGPYHGEHTIQATRFAWDLRQLHERADRPGPDQDGFRREISRGWKSACQYRGQLNEWFSDVSEDELRSNDYRLAAYRVPRHAIVSGKSGMQLAYNPAMAQLVGRV